MFLHSSVRDGLSFSLGIISVITMCVSEIPQIMTNYREKSTEGLSIAFLTTWLVGDIMNLVGCLMDTATLRTQLYTALFHTVTTSLLYVQIIYYGHIYPRLNNRRNERIEVERISNISSGSYLAQRMASEPTLEAPLLPENATPPSTKSMLCVVSAFLFIGTFNLPNLISESKTIALGERDRVFVVGAARNLLQVTSGNVTENQNSKIAIFLGWPMAAIYLGGRLPQICLNMRRGHVEGLNPLMFFIAFVSNIAYVASILVRSVEWSKISPNLPWLVDAGGCVVLDFIILLQFVYYRCRKGKGKDKDSDKKKHETAGAV
ncbi:hypothetical protein AALP_AA4G147300 [Arabis alpina]|uniref:Uncharacterized protein n=1 Tax=Arabis alpina TaxID=50452 RepID=A0A087H3B8_ARAAL|nr:hypothetical protein AALP_AA4G147300 [Arabis alpina]